MKVDYYVQNQFKFKSFLNWRCFDKRTNLPVYDVRNYSRVSSTRFSVIELQQVIWFAFQTKVKWDGAQVNLQTNRN